MGFVIKSAIYHIDEKDDHSVRLASFVFLFYLFYFIVSYSIGKYLINYIDLSFKACALYFVYAFFLIVGVGIGSKIYPRNLITRIPMKASHILFLGGGLCLVILIYHWKLLILKYGSIEAIMAQSNLIRIDTIASGKSLIPVWMNYLLCSVFVLWPISLESYFTKPKFIKAIGLFLIALMILLFDLRTFGRIGMIYAIFCLIGAFLIHRVRVFTLPRAVLLICLYFGMMLPRIIRGGFIELSYYLKPYSFKVLIPPVLAGVMLIIIYYFSSLYAFSALLDTDIVHTHGMKTFAALINMVDRFFTLDVTERVMLIDKFVMIPFPHNVFLIVGDLYRDFKVYGLVFFPLFFGLFMGVIFNGKSFSSRVLQFILLAWLFYSPIYNMFSFGTFLLPFVFAIFLKLFINIKYD